VLDANVYVSAAVNPEGPPGQIIERFLREAAFENVVSPAICDEVLRVLDYPKVRRWIRAGLDPHLWFEGIVVLSLVVAGEYEAAGVSSDPDGGKYIAAAVEGLAEFIVTGDTDLLALTDYEGICIISPRAFLQRLSI
jgi:putative PIN family toxin of toxin-antitoxin system